MKKHYLTSDSESRNHSATDSRIFSSCCKAFCLVALFASVLACSPEQKEPEKPDDPTPTPTPVVPDKGLTVTAKTENLTESKTVSEGGVNVLWEVGDQIAVFAGDKKGKFTADLTESSASATFKGEMGYDSWPDKVDLWAIYPYSSDFAFDGKMFTATLPAEQTARENSFGKGMNLAVAHSTSSTLQFYNVGGGIRFSVTEEGIKKVMFEGLDGEKIAGKIKISLDSKGIPVVKEVSDGSQFITLLPPSGEQTFKKDTWYHIVAIPGSLDKGYKVRFYKDKDYARKISEKASAINRSAFINLEKADNTIEYETTTGHTPASEEEWTESITFSQDVAYTLSGLVQEYKEGEIDMSTLKKQFEKVDGILKVETIDDASTIAVMQKDSIWINCPLYDDRMPDASPAQSTTSFSVKSRPSATGSWNISQTSAGEASPVISPKGYYVTPGKKALILSPFHHEFNTPIDEWEKLLKKTFEVVDVYKDEEARVTRFRESHLAMYDFILIDTHGGLGHLAVNQFHLLHLLTYHLTTGTKYTVEGALPLLLLDMNPKELTVTLHDGELYMCMTPHFLKDKKLNNCVVIISACSSAYRMFNFEEDDANGSLAGAFLNNGARLVSGAIVDMRSGAQRLFDDLLMRYMTYGLSFQTAFEYITNSEKTEKAVKEYADFYPDTEYQDWDVNNNYRYNFNSKSGNEPFFFFDPIPNNLNYEKSGDGVKLTWDCNLESFTAEWKKEILVSGATPRDYKYKVSYDIYVDGSRLGKTLYTDDTVKYAFYKGATGNHTWHVEAKIMEGDNVIFTYISKDSNLTITEQAIPVESVSLDKTQLELTVGTKATLTATVLPENAANRKVFWSSDKTSIATVSDSGEITAIAKGEAVITVKTEDGGKTATCKVTVKDPKGGGDHEGTEEDPWN